MEKETFEIEVRRLRPSLVRYANSILHDGEESEDIVQDSLLKLWFLHDRLDAYRSIDSVAFVITGRLSLNRLRDRKSTLGLDALPESCNETEETNEDSKEMNLTALIDSLPTVEQAVMRLKHIEGMETEEIARLVSSTPSAVRVALSRARKKIRDKFISEE